MHHMMFGLWYSDYGTIIDEFLPIIKEDGYDLFFNGHEHHLNYAFTPSKELLKYSIPWYKLWSRNDEVCHENMEIFPLNGTEKESRHIITEHGDRINQLTIGGSGQPLYKICDTHVKSSLG